MTLDRRLTGGLAWAGLLLVIAVPSADALTSMWSPEGANVVEPIAEKPAVQPQTPATKPVAAVETSKPVATKVATQTQQPANPAVVAAKPAPETKPVVQPAATPASKPSGSAVNSYIASGKQLPSYISGGDAQQTAAITPAPAVSQPAPVVSQPAPAPVASQPIAPAQDTEVANIAPQPELVAPIPMPASMRPHPRVVPKVVASTNHGDDYPDQYDQEHVVGAQDLRNWESGPLSEFLAQRNRRNRDDQGDGNYIEYNADNGGYRRDNNVIYLPDTGNFYGY